MRPPAIVREQALQVVGNPNNKETYLGLQAAFARETGDGAAVGFTPRESDETLRDLLMRTFTNKPLPDCAFLNGDVVRPLFDRGLLAPLGPFLADEGAGEGLRPFAVGASPAGLQVGLSVPVVVVNQFLAARAASWRHGPFASWDEVIGIAKAIGRAAPEAVGGFFEHDNGGALSFQFLIESFGLRPMNPDERDFGFRGPIGLQALKVLQGFGEAGQASADMSRRQARRAFAAGRLGVFVTMSSMLPSFHQAAEGKFEFEATPLPAARPGATTPAAGPVGVVFASDPARERRAWRFLRFAAGPAGQAIVAGTSGYLPAHPAEGAEARLIGLGPERRIDSWYTFPGRNALKIAELIKDEMQQIATLQAAPGDALQAILTGVAPLLPNSPDRLRG